MKCNNCGYTNAAGRLQCEHCNAPLQGSVIAPLAGKKKQAAGGLKCTNCDTLNAPGSIKCGHCNAPLKGSILDAPAVQPPPAAKVNTDMLRRSIDCPHCGYPNLKPAAGCVKCGKAFGEGPAMKVAEPPKVVRKPNPIPDGTINPWSQPVAPAAKFRLKPLTRSGEPAMEQLEFQGDRVELNRENLEPANRTITGKTQARLEHRDGAWHLSNESAQKSTFLLVQGPVVLKKGDIILMGDRMFEFDC